MRTRQQTRTSETAPFWANVIEQETDNDLGQIRLAGVLVPAQAARTSAEIVAEVLATRPMRALNNHSLIEIQDWDDVDEDIASELRRVLTMTPSPFTLTRAAPDTMTIVLPDLTAWPSPLDKAEILLESAAEIEHALMVQYLYAAYSLKSKVEVRHGTH